MATKEIPIVGHGSKLLRRVEVAEGTMAFYFENSISNRGSPPTSPYPILQKLTLRGTPGLFRSRKNLAGTEARATEL